MEDKHMEKKLRPPPSRRGLLLFSVAVGATAVGAYFFAAGDKSEGAISTIKRFLCDKFECSTKPHECGEWDSSWDKQTVAKFLKDDGVQELSKDKKAPIVTRHLVFVRHGQYHDNFKNDSERMLTEKGRQQATHTGRRLREMGLKFDVFVHSTMRRAVETADLIAKELSMDPSVELTLSETDLLREGHPIVPIPYYGKSITSKDQDRIEAAFTNFFHRPPPSQSKDTYELYVCHANVIRYLALRALQLAPTAWLRFSIAHASVTWISIRSDGSVSLRRMGEAGHIPVELETR